MQYTLQNRIIATILVNTYTIKFSFIDEKFAKIIYKRLEIQPQHLTKQKPIL